MAAGGGGAGGTFGEDGNEGSNHATGAGGGGAGGGWGASYGFEGLGGTGGTSSSLDGGNGADGEGGLGGDGGGGGYHGTVVDGDLTNHTEYVGGNGGKGGNGDSGGMGDADGTGGGGGGAGGFGGVISGDITNDLMGSFTGGDGGAGGGGGNGGGSGGDGVDGGDGGNGGAGLLSTGTSRTITNYTSITGGTGGAGGDGGASGNGNSNDDEAGKGSTGGAGGDGVVIVGESTTLINAGTIIGGKGGSGGDGGSGGGYGGNGSAGGAGVKFIATGGALINSGTISGGAGGAAGEGRNGGNSGGSGSVGYGVIGSDLSITNSGTINGGISFTGGTNSLTLEAGSTINGRVLATKDGNDTLALGGDEDESFDLSTIGTQYLGFADFEKTGNSIWTLSGTTDPQLELDPMPWTIRDGTLVVGDADHTDTNLVGSVRINAYNTLAGFGTITGNVSNYLGGTVMPGSLLTTGKLTIDGNYTQIGDSSDYTGTLAVLVMPEGASQLAVTGTATLGGTVNAIYAPGVYTAKSYTILTASSINGTFETLLSKTPEDFTLEQSLGYGDTSVDLVLGESRTVTPSDASTFTSTTTASIDSSFDANDTLLDHMGNGESGTGSDSEASLTYPIQVAMAGEEGLNGLLAPAPDHKVWLKATGRLSSLDGDGTISGVNTASGGFLAGVDKTLNDKTLIGLAAGYDRTYVSESDGNSAHIDTPRIAFYGSYKTDLATLDATLGYAHNFIDTRRPITATGDVARASHGGDEVSAALQGRHTLDVNGARVTPRIGVQYAHLTEGSFSESGAPGFNLDVASNDADSLRPYLGVTTAKTYTTQGGTRLTPHVDVAVSRELIDDAPSSTVSVGGGSFIVNGVTPSKTRLSLGTGLDVTMSENLSVHVGYRATMPTGNLFAQSVELSATLKF